MLRQNDDRVDCERTFRPDLAKGFPQGGDIVGQRPGAAVSEHHGEEETRPWDGIAAVVNHGSMDLDAGGMGAGWSVMGLLGNVCPRITLR